MNELYKMYVPASDEKKLTIDKFNLRMPLFDDGLVDGLKGTIATRAIYATVHQKWLEERQTKKRTPVEPNVERAHAWQICSATVDDSESTTWRTWLRAQADVEGKSGVDEFGNNLVTISKRDPCVW